MCVCVCVCVLTAAAADPLAADTVFWKVNRSQYVPVFSAKPAPISRNRWVFVQQDRGTVENTEELRHRELLFFFYLLKEALTGAHTILGNVFPSISSLSALVSPHSFLPFSSFSSLSRAPPPALASPPPSWRILLFLAPSHRSHSLNSHLTVIFDRRRTPLTV